MEEEMESMNANQVWDFVDLPPRWRFIGNKWILKIKRKADGSIEWYKARLVVKGYTQEERIDYEDTFSPVVRITSVHLILAIVAHMDLELYQMDVKTAFLNGELDEENIWINLYALSLKDKSAKYASSKDPYMVLNRHLSNGTSSFIMLF